MTQATHLVLGQSIPGNSFLHRIHPVLKILILLVHCILIFQFKSSWELLAVVLAELLLIRMLPFSLRLLISGYFPFLILLGFTFFMNWISFASEIPESHTVTFKIFGLAGTQEGLEKGIFFSLRVLTILLASSLLTLSTSSVEITYALDKLLKPFKRFGFPAEEFALMMSISLRFIPVLFEELKKIRRAQEARGASLKRGNLSKKARVIQSLMIPLLQSSMQRADQLAIAMEVRGFDPQRERTSIQEHQLKWLDASTISTYLLCMVLIYQIP